MGANFLDYGLGLLFSNNGKVLVSVGSWGLCGLCGHWTRPTEFSHWLHHQTFLAWGWTGHNHPETLLGVLQFQQAAFGLKLHTPVNDVLAPESCVVDFILNGLYMFGL